jgi:hypothetical protein
MPPCRTITVIALRGDRSPQAAASFQSLLDAEKKGGPGPSMLDCQLFAGHVGISTDGGKTIWGFNPDGRTLPIWQMLDNLKNGDAFRGIVRDDTHVFATAKNYLSFEVVLPDPSFQHINSILDAERQKSQYSYGFPSGDGDCNCITWLERLGLPLLTGRMNEFITLRAIISNPSRRFGQCV